MVQSPLPEGRGFRFIKTIHILYRSHVKDCDTNTPYIAPVSSIRSRVLYLLKNLQKACNNGGSPSLDRWGWSLRGYNGTALG